MEAEAILGLACANLAACITPGQNTALVAVTASRCGWAGGLWAILGVVVAEAVWTAIAFLAIAGAISLHQDAQALLNLACGIVLAAFGAALLAAPAAPAAASGWRRVECRHVPRLVLSGLMVGLANPLALVFFVAVLPLFVSDTGAPALAAATAAVCITSALAIGTLPAGVERAVAAPRAGPAAAGRQRGAGPDGRPVRLRRGALGRPPAGRCPFRRRRPGPPGPPRGGRPCG